MGLILLAALYYLFIGGHSDIGLGVVGQYDKNGAYQQGFVFPGPEFFLRSLAVTRVSKDLRRLVFRCPDGSKSFTVYRTFLGVYGIPDESVTCDDGFKLLEYNPSKGYVIEVPKGG